MSESVRLPLSNGGFVLIDADDYDWLSAYRWRSVKRGQLFYAARYGGSRGSCVYMHREILSAPRDRLVDHANCDGLDNRRENIRLCNRQQNSANARFAKGKGSRYRGVNKQTLANSWSAEIKISGERYYLGTFKTPELAARAYDAAALAAFGKFARPNFPNNPDTCAGSGLSHCYACRKAMETASVTEAA